MVEVTEQRRVVIREISLAWEERLRRVFDGSFRKYIRVVHGVPSRERIGGKLPAVAVHLFDINLTEHARVGKRLDSKRQRGDLRGLRLDYQFSAWVEDALDEQLLLDCIRTDIDMDRTLVASPGGGASLSFSIDPKPSIKFDSSISFWSSLGWPPKVSLQYSVRAR